MIYYISFFDKNYNSLLYYSWKDPNCEFRVNTTTKLTCVPTLLKWGTNKRLLDYQCNNLETVLLMFED